MINIEVEKLCMDTRRLSLRAKFASGKPELASVYSTQHAETTEFQVLINPNISIIQDRTSDYHRREHASCGDI
jgi:hypothetical protein